MSLARSALAATAMLCGVLLILFAEPPAPAWVAGDDLSGDWRPALLAFGVLGLYVVAMMYQPLRERLELAPLPLPDILLIGLVVAVWAVALRFTWRRRLFERLLSRHS